MGIGRSRFAWLGILAILAVAIGVGGSYLSARSPDAASTSTSGSAPSTPSGLTRAPAPSTPRSSNSPGSGGTSGPATLTSGVSPSPAGATKGATSPGTRSTPPTPAPGTSASGAAPTSAAGFDPRHTVVPMGFPLPATARYRYGAVWRAPRLGIVYPYNEIRGVAKDGTLLRAHDGVDVEVAIGTPVMSPFTGVIVNPAALWKPWDPQRYGNVVVVRSSESTSRGYYAILVHLSTRSVKVGQKVTRGQIVGRTGSTGNADGTVPHLHVELRAPFEIEFHYAGVERFLDVFDPLPSLEAADPHLR